MVSEAGHEPALTTLIELYNHRPDLQEVYPEAASGDFRRLIDWAAGVSAKRWLDGACFVLGPYMEWYAQRITGTPPQISLSLPMILNTSLASANPMPLTVSTMLDESANDINQHLSILLMLVVEFGLNRVVELGTNTGSSTLTLLEAVKKIGGEVVSVDVQPCLDARQRVARAGLEKCWRFVQGNDLELNPEDLPHPIDLLFIDTNHFYAQTIAELKHYAPYLTEGSWIALHDLTSYPGVARAVEEFVKSLHYKPAFYPFLNQNGLALIRLGNSTRSWGQPDTGQLQTIELAKRVGDLEKRFDRYIDVFPLRWIRRLRATLHGLPPPP